MIDKIDMIIAIVLSCLVFIFYTNSTMPQRKNYIMSNISIILGYILIYAVSLYNIQYINIAVSVAVNFFLIYLCFKTNIKNAIIQSLLLVAIMMISEGIISMFTDICSEVNGLSGKSLGVKMIHAVVSKLIYFTGIVIVKFISKDKSKNENYSVFFSLLTFPVFTMLFISGIMLIFDNINEQQRIMFAFISIFGVISNVIIYWMHDKTLIYQKEIRKLQEQKHKNDMELMYYNMIEDKIEETRIMRHDFKEHLNILESYIDNGNSAAKEYLKSIELKSDAAGIINYANNTVLNIILSKKHKLCAKKGIILKIHASDVSFDFMKDIDIVSIFSNLLNNAIESSEKSVKKIIYVNIYKMNNAFVVIKIDNSCDQPPKEENGFYKTTKISDGEHGMGLKSVAKAVKNYSGDLRLDYKSEDKIFSAMIMIPLA